MKLLFIGNFEPPYSTENELKWTFEHLGWEVTAVQENADNPTVLMQDHALFLWVHTHGWDKNVDTFKEFLSLAIKAGIPTASFHLDRYWGLNKNDRREDLIGQHPFWHTDTVFTADGGDHDWKGRGVNHHWLKPGVVERDCYIGEPRNEYEVDVAFVGSQHYHPEYKERSQLITWLEQTYGDRFRRFAGDTPSGTVRGKDLNDLYASVKVVVGDSCFANHNEALIYSSVTGDYSSWPNENYWSDRIAETTGRGGFLMHPQTPGLDHEGIIAYEPGGIATWNYKLKHDIDYWLEHDQQREEIRQQGYKWTKNNATYTNRVKEMLSIIGIS